MLCSTCVGEAEAGFEAFAFVTAAKPEIFLSGVSRLQFCGYAIEITLCGGRRRKSSGTCCLVFLGFCCFGGAMNAALAETVFGVCVLAAAAIVSVSLGLVLAIEVAPGMPEPRTCCCDTDMVEGAPRTRADDAMVGCAGVITRSVFIFGRFARDRLRTTTHPDPFVTNRQSGFCFINAAAFFRIGPFRTAPVSVCSITKCWFSNSTAADDLKSEEGLVGVGVAFDAPTGTVSRMGVAVAWMASARAAGTVSRLSVTCTTVDTFARRADCSVGASVFACVSRANDAAAGATWPLRGSASPVDTTFGRVPAFITSSSCRGGCMLVCGVGM